MQLGSPISSKLDNPVSPQVAPQLANWFLSQANWNNPILPLFLTLAALILAGCRSQSGNSDSSEPNGKLKALATVGMVADLVREIGGDEVSVTQLLGSGVDPHLYKPNRDDVQQILQADIVFYGGLMLEGKMSDSLAKVGKNKPTVAVSEGIDLRLIHDQSASPNSASDSSHTDPHVWMNVKLWSQAATVVAEALAEADPDHSGLFATRCLKLQEKLSRLHEYGLSIMKTIPEESRVLITSHDAFRYFGTAYGLQVEPIQGISTESEAGLQRINQLVDMIVTRKVPSVFIESSVPKDSIMALIRGAESRGASVTIGATLYSDAMGELGTYEGTYVGMLDHNLTSVAKGLGGSPPEGGFQALELALQQNSQAATTSDSPPITSPNRDAVKGDLPSK